MTPLDTVTAKAYDALRTAESFRLVMHDLMAMAERKADPVERAGAMSVILRLLRYGHPLEKVRQNHGRHTSKPDSDSAA